MNSLIRYFSVRYLPRWLVLIFDLAIVLFSWVIAFHLRFNFHVTEVLNSIHPLHPAVIVPVSVFCFWKHNSYAGILRHSTTRDVMRIISSMACIGIILTVISLAGRYLNAPPFLILPASVIIMMVFLTGSLMILSRVVAKLIFQHYNRNTNEEKKVIIFGAGQMGQITRNALIMDSSENIKIACFIDDNPSLHRKYIAGIPVYSLEKAFDEIVTGQNIAELIFAVDDSKISPSRKRQVTDRCLQSRLEVKEVPPFSSWVEGKLMVKAIRRIHIEDLLGRDAIHLNRERIIEGLKESTVLVTGAAGSIGSEIVRQLISFRVNHVILLDKAESDLFNLEQELLAQNHTPNFEVVVGDVTNEEKMRKIFELYHPTIVFNAAAYKHVPLMEKFPAEALRVNVGGTKILANLAGEYGVDKFVFISTDKAVNPTNVMGASKRISEVYIQSLAQSGRYKTKFITTRFGNVLGSNGSVVPLFKKQIEKGGPVTVTHKDITRYFMTIPEACQLVLEAGFMGKGGEIFVFDMGEPVKIYHLAEKMISLSGFTPHKDIAIKVTGLRPGEKLYEELLDNHEKLMPTHNDKIMIGRVRPHDHDVVSYQVSQLLRNIDRKKNTMIVTEMRFIVPEFNPANLLYKRSPEPIKNQNNENENHLKEVVHTGGI